MIALYSILSKSFSKSSFENYVLLFAFLIEIDVFKFPCKAILDVSFLDEAILVSVNYSQNYLLQSVG
jgi:hypothetical protein